MGYVVARNLDDVWPALAAGADVIAGGTDWFPGKGDHVANVLLLDMSAVPGFAAIEAVEGGWRIGAAVTWSAVLKAELPACFDALKAAAREVGSVQIQNVGTVAGNLCNASPAADGVPPLMALGASVELASERGVRVLPLAAFLRGPRQTALEADEIVSAILVPAQPEGAVSAWAKVGSRAYLVISIAMVAVQACVVDGRLRDVRIAVGACGPVASRLSGLEARLEGAAAVAVTRADLAELSPMDDVRGSADYRLDLVVAEVARLLRGVL